MNAFKRHLRHSAAAVVLLLAAAVYAAAPPGRIYDTRAARDISPDELVRALEAADMVLVGEKHDEAAHHQAQVWLLQQTAKRRARGSVLLEMLDASQQQDVSAVQQWLLDGGKTAERRLPEKMGWNNAWKWQDYAGVVGLIMRQPAKVLAANPTRENIRKAASFVPQGQNSGEARVRQVLSRIMSGNHGSSEGMVAMQQFKDHTMAQNLMAAPKPAWLLAGAIHASKQLGVPLFLRDAGAKGDVKVLVLTHKGSDIDHHHGDYVWYLEAAK